MNTPSQAFYGSSGPAGRCAGRSGCGAVQPTVPFPGWWMPGVERAGSDQPELQSLRAARRARMEVDKGASGLQTDPGTPWHGGRATLTTM